MMIEYMEPDFTFDNENGLLKQLVHDGWKQVNIIWSKAGSVRGGHFHKYNEECFYVVSGRFDLELWKVNYPSEVYKMGQGEFFKISPYVYHTFTYLEETVLVSMYSCGVELENGEKDIWIE